MKRNHGLQRPSQQNLKAEPWGSLPLSSMPWLWKLAWTLEMKESTSTEDWKTIWVISDPSIISWVDGWVSWVDKCRLLLSLTILNISSHSLIKRINYLVRAWMRESPLILVNTFWDGNTSFQSKERNPQRGPTFFWGLRGPPNPITSSCFHTSQSELWPQ